MRYNLQMLAALPKADLRAVSEYDFQVAVTRYAKAQGWMPMYFRKTATQGKDRWVAVAPPGWPDLTLLRLDKLVCIECKSEKGKPTEAQQLWLAGLDRVAGVSTYLFRPSDASTVMQVLA